MNGPERVEVEYRMTLIELTEKTASFSAAGTEVLLTMSVGVWVSLDRPSTITTTVTR